jgi:hypothetical protein
LGFGNLPSSAAGWLDDMVVTVLSGHRRLDGDQRHLVTGLAAEPPAHRDDCR